jgi:transposase-like protein
MVKLVMKYCPKCQNTNICKDGVMNQKQRYLCKDCNYHFTRKQLEPGVNGKPALVQQAIQLHLENVSFRGIGRLIGVHYQTVINWLRTEANKIDTDTFKPDIAEVVELDEMHLYLGKKKTTFGSGLQ